MDQTAYFEQMRQKRRDEILAAAKSLILKEGLDAFQMQRLARELDISTVTLYKYFKNSDDVMSAVQKQILDSGDLFMQRASVQKDAMERLLQTIRNFYMNALEQRNAITLLFLFQVQSKEAGEDMLASKMYEVLYGMIEEAKQDGKINSGLKLKSTVDFIVNVNLALIERIALMNEDVFQKQKKELNMQAEQLILMVRLYLTTET
ncbi:TetR/AcrR family transcriptional regulator [Anaerobium acetethylicum]|uniref:Regulatory protein, tetR family n=1 Tax=Anaerobium acetethylicum TaxID=1619234 RepID=A0A1D3TSZ3_9FIRM|nr:TetR/AcrR family transcriptional regulator [Anaerobium acetethylicum]SCP97052.1 regulatory protein, tetR family [Anaerobium acetethylicum]